MKLTTCCDNRHKNEVIERATTGNIIKTFNENMKFT